VDSARSEREMSIDHSIHAWAKTVKLNKRA
jgi:hypothetical protein